MDKPENYTVEFTSRELWSLNEVLAVIILLVKFSPQGDD